MGEGALWDLVFSFKRRDPPIMCHRNHTGTLLTGQRKRSVSQLESQRAVLNSLVGNVSFFILNDIHFQSKVRAHIILFSAFYTVKT